MAIQSLYPNIAPSLELNFAGSRTLDPRVTFARASTARFYDGRTVAKAEENLLIWSQEFDNVIWWEKENSTVIANNVTAPNGTTTAETLTDNATSGVHGVVQPLSIINASADYACSVFVKANTHNFVQLMLRDSAVANRYITAVADLSAGTITQTGSGSAGTLISSAIANAGNGWYRIQIVGSLSAVSSIGMQLLVRFAPAASGNTISSSGSISYSGTGTSFYLWGAQLEQRSAVTAYTPTTTQPITNYIPVLQTAAANVPRFDHNPVTGESLGLLIEEQRTNLLVRSKEFDNAVWSTANGTVVANTVVAPDGALTGDAFIENTDAGNHQVAQAASVTSGLTYVLSVYAKAASSRQLNFVIANTNFTTTPQAVFNLQTGDVVSSGSGTASITPVGNGWYRCTLVTIAATSTGSNAFIIRLHNGSTNSYTGDGFSGIYIWGAQLEAGAFPTSYIPTVASQVTRSADAASMTGANFSSWYRQDEGTLYGESSSLRDTTTRWPFGVDDGSASNLIGVRFTSTQVQNRVFVSGVSQADIGVSHTTGYAKTALGYAFNNVAASVDGGTVGIDTSANIPVVSQLSIGRVSGGSTINGTIRKIAFYPRRLTNPELQGLTS